jgi:hypothetical protein
VKTDATQQGVSEDPRAAIYAKAEESREAELKADGVEIDKETPDDWEEGEGSAQETAPEETPEAAVEPTTEEAPQETQPTPEQTVRLKVDGVEVERPLSWVVAQAQKLAAADRRLEEASKAKTLYEARLAEVESLKPAPAPAVPKRPSLPADLSDVLKALARKQLETTDEGEFADIEAEKASVYQEAARREWNAREASNQEAVKMRQLQEAQKTLLEKVTEAHADVLEVANTEDFQKWVGDQTQATQFAWAQSMDPRDGIDVLNRYKAFKNPVQGFEAKKEAKRGMDTIRSANARAIPPKAEDDEDESDSAYIKKIQQLRNPHRGVSL